jgi:CRP-like cAMP-binding protein
MGSCHPVDCLSCFTEIRGIKFNAGAKIVKQGEMPQGLYFVQSGLIKLEIMSRTGTILTLRIAKGKEFFGYRSLLSEEPCYFSATALTDATLCLLPKQHLDRAIEDNPQLAKLLIKQLAMDLKTSDQRWLSQTSEGAHERVERALKELNESVPQYKWTKREIAQIAGTTTETVFRSISKSNRNT